MIQSENDLFHQYFYPDGGSSNGRDCYVVYRRHRYSNVFQILGVFMDVVDADNTEGGDLPDGTKYEQDLDNWEYGFLDSNVSHT